MTGGMAFVLDHHGSFAENANPDSIVWQRLDSAYWEEQLKALIMAHAHSTDSKWSHSIIEDWDRRRGEFWQICPKEMLMRLAQPLSDSEALEAAE
jgi:glutamate synthase (NADPH/NADH) large chain